MSPISGYFENTRGSTQIGSRLFRWGKRTYVMAVLNVTPDSFSGDGMAGNVDKAVDTALRFADEGADIIDVGGESTRPPSIYAGSEPVSDEQELGRVIPVIRALARKIDIPISVDTYRGRTAKEAIEAGASLVNDVWGLKGDPLMAPSSVNFPRSCCESIRRCPPPRSASSCL